MAIIVYFSFSELYFSVQPAKFKSLFELKSPPFFEPINIINILLTSFFLLRFMDCKFHARAINQSRKNLYDL